MMDQETIGAITALVTAILGAIGLFIRKKKPRE